MTVTGNVFPEATIAGFDIYTLTVSSDMGSLLGFDFEGDPVVPDDRGIFGEGMKSFAPLGLPTVFSNNNLAIQVAFGPDAVRLDSQFLFNADGVPSVTVPDGFANERAGFLGATFALTAPLDEVVDIARVVLPAGGSGWFEGMVVVQGDDFIEFPVAGLIGPYLNPDLFDLPSGGAINMLPALFGVTDVIDDALTLTDPLNSITFIELINNNGDVFGAAIDGQNIDLSVNRAVLRSLPPGSLPSAILNVRTARGDASFTLCLCTPEPASSSLFLIGLVGLTGLRRPG